MADSKAIVFGSFTDQEIMSLLQKQFSSLYFACEGSGEELKKQGLEKSNSRDGESRWSNLETNLLCSINFRLFGADRIRFNSVCKSWSSSIPSPSEFFSPFSSPTKPNTILQFLTSILPAKRVMEILQFPTLMFSAYSTSNRSFFNPLLNTTFRFTHPDLNQTKIQFSKGGWFLVSQEKCQLFFFNPFTEEKIKLPNLLREEPTKGRLFSFSTLPTSPDCVVMAVRKNLQGNILYIRRGEATWKSFEARTPDLHGSSFTIPIFFDGAFYFLNQEGREERYSKSKDSGFMSSLCKFNPTNKDSEVIWEHEEPKPTPMKFDYLVECEGELMATFENKMSVYKLDRAAKAWERVKDLGDGMLFFSTRTLQPLSASAKEGLRGMRNKIYSPKFVSGRTREGVFYSLSTEKYHSLSLMTESFVINELGGDDCVWIQPCFEKHCGEELTWYDDLEGEVA